MEYIYHIKVLGYYFLMYPYSSLSSDVLFNFLTLEDAERQASGNSIGDKTINYHSVK